MSIKVSYPQEWLNLEEDLLEIKTEIIKSDVTRILAAEQAKGFPTDPDDYQLFLKNRGSTKRRQLGTISPKHLKIPFSLKFVSFGDMESCRPGRYVCILASTCQSTRKEREL